MKAFHVQSHSLWPRLRLTASINHRMLRRCALRLLDIRSWTSQHNVFFLLCVQVRRKSRERKSENSRGREGTPCRHKETESDRGRDRGTEEGKKDLVSGQDPDAILSTAQHTGGPGLCVGASSQSPGRTVPCLPLSAAPEKQDCSASLKLLTTVQQSGLFVGFFCVVVVVFSLEEE